MPSAEPRRMCQAAWPGRGRGWLDAYLGWQASSSTSTTTTTTTPSSSTVPPSSTAPPSSTEPSSSTAPSPSTASRTESGAWTKEALPPHKTTAQGPEGQAAEHTRGHSSSSTSLAQTTQDSQTICLLTTASTWRLGVPDFFGRLPSLFLLALGFFLPVRSLFFSLWGPFSLTTFSFLLALGLLLSLWSCFLSLRDANLIPASCADDLHGGPGMDEDEGAPQTSRRAARLSHNVCDNCHFPTCSYHSAYLRNRDSRWLPCSPILTTSTTRSNLSRIGSETGNIPRRSRMGDLWPGGRGAREHTKAWLAAAPPSLEVR